MKIAVIYYSLEGNTKKVAEKIADKFNADIYEIKEVKGSVPTSGFFKYFWGGKQVVTKKKPEIEDLNINIDEYDVLFIGTPSWVATYAPVFRTFFSKYEIKGKKIGLFCSHGGGPGETIKKMENELIGNEIIARFDLIEPLKNKGSDEKIDKWLESINI